MMNLDAVKLSQLRALLSIANHGNFSEAALSLGISQSAVSHAIAGLEEALGVVLLSRGRHGATLTPVGERVVNYAQQMLHLLDMIGKEANLTRGLEGGQLRVASFRSVATHILPGVIARFRQAFPGISISVTEHRADYGVEDALREGRADIGFVCLPPPPDLEHWELMRDDYLVLLPPSATVSNDPITWEQLAQYPLIMPAAADYCSIVIREYMSEQRQHLPAAYEIHEDSTIVSMVSQGLGATIIARLAAEPLPPNIQVRHLPEPLSRVIRVAILSEALHTPAVYAFMNVLKEYLESRQQEIIEAIGAKARIRA